MYRTEPVLTRASIAAVIVAVAGLIGWQVDEAVVDTIAGIVAVIAPVVAGWFARRHVTPTGKLPPQ